MSQQNALLVALNALQAIDDEHPYPIAKHAIEQIKKALRPVKSYTNGEPQYATDDMSTKPQNVYTSEERVHEIDKSIHEEIERLKAEIKRANELAEYRLKLLMQMPENKPWDTSDMAHCSGGLSVEQKPYCWVQSKLSQGMFYKEKPRRIHTIPLYTTPPSKPDWVSLSDREITGAAHNEAKYPVSILETTDSGLCMQFSETGEWHASDKRGDFMKVNGFLMSFARAIEAALRSKNNG